jgi:hypothetical protein
MSILDKLKKVEAPVPKKLFGVVLGTRTAGKTTTVATLPGKTLLLQAAVLESGSNSAAALAKELGNELAVLSFNTHTELMEVLAELVKDTEFDNVAIDSLSGVTEQLDRTPEITRLKKGNVWDGFRTIGEKTSEALLAAKALTYPDKVTKAKNVVVLCAIDVKHDTNGNINEVELVSKGRMAVSTVSKLGEAVITILPPTGTGPDSQPRRILTKSQDFFAGRVDGVLDHNNPGVVTPASLASVIKLFQEGKI